MFEEIKLYILKEIRMTNFILSCIIRLLAILIGIKKGNKIYPQILFLDYASIIYYILLEIGLGLRPMMQLSSIFEIDFSSKI